MARKLVKSFAAVAEHGGSVLFAERANPFGENQASRHARRR